jgi:hypothetical protein
VHASFVPIEGARLTDGCDREHDREHPDDRGRAKLRMATAKLRMATAKLRMATAKLRMSTATLQMSRASRLVCSWLAHLAGLCSVLRSQLRHAPS